MFILEAGQTNSYAWLLNCRTSLIIIPETHDDSISSDSRCSQQFCCLWFKTEVSIIQYNWAHLIHHLIALSSSHYDSYQPQWSLFLVSISQGTIPSSQYDPSPLVISPQLIHFRSQLHSSSSRSLTPTPSPQVPKGPTTTVTLAHTRTESPIAKLLINL